MTDKQLDHAEREAFESWYNSYNPAHKSDKQRAKDAYAAALAAPQQAAPAVRLQWTIDTPPTDACRYDHCTAESPLGLFRIEWKGWKEHDSHCLYLNGEYIGVALTKEGAKEMAQNHIAALARQLAPYQRSEAPQQEVQEVMVWCDGCTPNNCAGCVRVPSKATK